MQTDQYCIYLRKSRADLEAEARGAGDTLARHERTLLDHARQRSLSIGAIYREIASGERIDQRPVMQQLLAEVEQGRWVGVLVTETSRLARGDTVDQGIVAQAFKYSCTMIITPQKDFDPTNEIDEEWFEIGLFMARQEYRMIRRRQVAGMQAAKREGRFLGNIAPYGYERVKLPRGWSLRPLPDQARVVRMIYDLYLSGMGYSRIADRLNSLHIPAAKGSKWTANTLPGMLSNPHYAGYIPSGRRPMKKQVQSGQLIISRPRVSDGELHEGLHEPIISRETWQRAQQRLNTNATSRATKRFPPSNPLAGLLVCDCCGRLMQRRPSSARQAHPIILCPTKGCATVSNNADEIERRVIDALRQFLSGLEMQNNQVAPDLSAEMDALAATDKQLSALDARLRKTFELVEDGTYTKEVFLSRQSELTCQRNELVEARTALQSRIDQTTREYEAQMSIAPQIRSILDAYALDLPALERNRLLKQIVARVDYHKRINNRWRADSDLSLTLHPQVFSFANH